MAIIVEDGTGVASSNAYDSVANTQAYFDLKGTVITITEEAIINATQYLDLRFGLQYNGIKTDADQSLSFPRSSFTDQEGFVRGAATIHKEVKQAMYEASKLYIDGTALFDDTDSTDSNLQSLTNTVEGAVSQSKTWFSPQNTNTKSNIGKYISNILKISSQYSVRVV